MTGRTRGQPEEAAAHAAPSADDQVEDVDLEEANDEAAALADAASDAAAHEVDAEGLTMEAEVVAAEEDADEGIAEAEAASDAAAHQLDSAIKSDDALPRGEDVTDGELITRLEELVPLTFGAMLLAVCYIGIYFAVEQLPRRTNPLPGPDWLPFF